MCVPYLNKTSAGALGLSNQLFSSEQLDIALSSVACNGSENSILTCNLNSHEAFCGPYDDAGVVCQGETTKPGF